MLRSQRAWCPACYNDDYVNQKIVYERLIWNFQLVNFCTQHNQYLSFKCPYCNKANPILTRKSKPGHCSVCENWLGELPKELPIINDLAPSSTNAPVSSMVLFVFESHTIKPHSFWNSFYFKYKFMIKYLTLYSKNSSPIYWSKYPITSPIRRS